MSFREERIGIFSVLKLKSTKIFVLERWAYIKNTQRKKISHQIRRKGLTDRQEIGHILITKKEVYNSYSHS